MHSWVQMASIYSITRFGLWRRWYVPILLSHQNLMIETFGSIKLKRACPTVESTRVLILGRGWLFYRHALFISAKSIHILHALLDFFTNTTLAIQSKYWHSSMKLASSNFLTSTATPAFRSGPWCFNFCSIGLNPYWMFSFMGHNFGV